MFSSSETNDNIISWVVRLPSSLPKQVDKWMGHQNRHFEPKVIMVFAEAVNTGLGFSFSFLEIFFIFFRVSDMKK